MCVAPVFVDACRCVYACAYGNWADTWIPWFCACVERVWACAPAEANTCACTHGCVGGGVFVRPLPRFLASPILSTPFRSSVSARAHTHTQTRKNTHTHAHAHTHHLQERDGRDLDLLEVPHTVCVKACVRGFVCGCVRACVCAGVRVRGISAACVCACVAVCFRVERAGTSTPLLFEIRTHRRPWKK